jgi:hypothetical protein
LQPKTLHHQPQAGSRKVKRASSGLHTHLIVSAYLLQSPQRKMKHQWIAELVTRINIQGNDFGVGHSLALEFVRLALLLRCVPSPCSILHTSGTKALFQQSIEADGAHK